MIVDPPATKDAPQAKPHVERVSVQEDLKRFHRMRSRKQPYLSIYQLIGEYIDGREMFAGSEFADTFNNGAFTISRNFDTKATKSFQLALSSFLSDLWPASPNRMVLEPAHGITETDEMKEYFERATANALDVLDNPEAGFAIALAESFGEDVKYGTSGVESQPDPETKVRFRSWGIRSLYIEEDAFKRVDTVGVVVPMTVRTLVDTYGIDAVSSESRKAHAAGEFDKMVNVLILVEPNRRAPTKRRRKGTVRALMPFRSSHIELTSGQDGQRLREEGFFEQPIAVARMFKVDGEEYGRSPGMDALPDVRSANVLWESIHLANHKNLDPPLGVIESALGGTKVVDSSPGGLTPVSERAGERPPIFPLFPPSEVKQSVNLLEMLIQSISEHFFLDRLLDFNTDKEMTLGETELRNTLRNKALAAVYTRLIMEKMTPVIKRTVNILMDQGELGVLDNGGDPTVLQIPAEIAERIEEGREWFKIRYLTPAMRVMRSEEATGIISTFNFAGGVAETWPEGLDVLDITEAIKRLGVINGMPSQIRKSDEAIASIREDRAARAEEARQLEQLKAGADAFRNMGQSNMQGATSVPA